MRLCPVASACLLLVLTGCNQGTKPSPPASSPQEAATTTPPVPAPTPAAPRPLDSVAVLPVTGQWDTPDGAGPDWPQKLHTFLEVLLPDGLSKGLVEQAPPGSLKILATEVVRDRMPATQSATATGKAARMWRQCCRGE